MKAFFSFPTILTFLLLCASINLSGQNGICEDADQFTTECGTVFDLCIDYSTTRVNQPVHIIVTSNDVSIFDPCSILLPQDADLLPQNGSVTRLSSPNSCPMEYTPNLDYVGMDSFDYFFFTTETCNGGPLVCFDENGNPTNVGKIWEIEFVYYGPSGTDLEVKAQIQGQFNTVVGSISNLQSGSTYVMRNTTLGNKHVNWSFDFSDGSDGDTIVHTSCSQDILGVNFGYFMPTGVCAAGANAGPDCEPAGNQSRSALMPVNSNLVQDITRVYIMIQSLLPIEFSYITGRAANLANVVQWGIASVNEEEELILQKSDDGIIFEDIMVYDEFEAGDFKYVDEDVRSVRTYYRLKSLSIDGEESLSESLVISNMKMNGKTVQVYPVPARDMIQWNATQDIVRVEVINMAGHIVHLAEVQGSRTLELSAQALNLQPGSYLSRVQLEDGSAVTRRLQVMD
ncbi:MAG: T9SS type A sorting domain-containing protein [Saprospiraceae bacterium]|nr:T9SS type A sorting domain-containing protein [Saprospiraceae bacterium]